MDLLSNLNEKQKEAVKYTEGPLLILAGPGSGKTKTLTHRVAYLISQGVRPSNILAVTFTNKAANEMKERVLALLSTTSETPNYNPKDLSTNVGEQNIKKAGMPLVGTFHSICVRILRENANLIGYTSSFVIYDDSDQLSLVKKVMKDLEISTEELSPRKALSLISRAKDNLLLPEEYEAQAGNYFERKIANIYTHYQKALAENNGFDFNDLIMQVVLLFENNENVLKKYQNRFKYVLVDEYQDTNAAQSIWLSYLARKSKNICAVGDDAQAIYSWRNAKVENILNFKREWRGAKVIKLEQNYRSTKNIVHAASALIKNNEAGYKKQLWTQNNEGEALNIIELGSGREEAEFILAEIENLAEQDNHKLSDFVVLYRTNAQSRIIEEIFLRNDMPYKIVGGVKFYQRKEIKDLIAWLRLVQNPGDTPSYERLEKLKLALMRKNIEQPLRTKKKAIKILAQKFREKASGQNTTLAQFIKFIIKESNFEEILRDGTEKGEERWQNTQELLSVAGDYAALPLKDAINAFLEDVTLMQEADNVERESELVHLMTMHMAKGLEFPVVFIAGCEEGLLPHSSSMTDKRQLEEERRLMYVGITRAKQKAYLLFARRRLLWGNIQSNPPSSFLFEIPEEYLSYKPLEKDVEYEDIIEWD
ncbi:MAG: UvrD-helicase domain-containing protein [Candidatus Spechtbacterales bacterium]|nr:UvrD-helicase domain-containing protein [Candidatus Spechtbacterales bacterium]